MRGLTRVVRHVIALSFLLLGTWSGMVAAQEIEARLYSNAPIDYNFLGLGFSQAITDKSQRSTESLSYTRTFDVFGQSGKVNVVLPYAELQSHTTVGGQVITRSAQGLADPTIRLSANLYGAPALSAEEFKHYQQDLIIGANVAVALPWGEYNSNQSLNVGTNRTFIQPGLGASQAVGPWRFELSGNATFFSNNSDYYGGRVLSEAPVYSATGHVIYYFPSTAWLSTDVTFYSGGQKSINGQQVGNILDSGLFGATLSIPVNAHNAIKFHAAEGSFFNLGQYYTVYGVVWQYRWGDGGK